MKPRLLDLFCGAGGVAKGYQRAGFYVVGVDIAPQPNYCGDEFFQADALAILDWWVEQPSAFAAYVAVHASPPCQAYTSLRNLGKGAGDGAKDLIGPVRERLERIGLPYVIENVEGSLLRTPVVICGSSIGLKVRRHRLFETNWPLMVPPCTHGSQGRPVAVYGDHPQKTDRAPWRAETVQQARDAMEMEWADWHELTQAIPPAYTQLIGHQLTGYLGAELATAARPPGAERPNPKRAA